MNNINSYNTRKLQMIGEFKSDKIKSYKYDNPENKLKLTLMVNNTIAQLGDSIKENIIAVKDNQGLREASAFRALKRNLFKKGGFAKIVKLPMLAASVRNYVRMDNVARKKEAIFNNVRANLNQLKQAICNGEISRNDLVGLKEYIKIALKEQSSFKLAKLNEKVVNFLGKYWMGAQWNPLLPTPKACRPSNVLSDEIDAKIDELFNQIF